MKIEVTRVGYHWCAEVADGFHPVGEFGRTVKEAVGGLVMKYQQQFSFEIEIERNSKHRARKGLKAVAARM